MRDRQDDQRQPDRKQSGPAPVPVKGLLAWLLILGLMLISYRLFVSQKENYKKIKIVEHYRPDHLYTNR